MFDLDLHAALAFLPPRVDLRDFFGGDGAGVRADAGALVATAVAAAAATFATGAAIADRSGTSTGLMSRFAKVV